MANIITVGMADLQSSRHPCILTTLGLGSCVGIALYDLTSKTAGLAHIMLPSSKQATNTLNIAKFADTAIAKLIDDMALLGADRAKIVAKLAGGAHMFAFSEALEIFRVGERNILSSKEVLKQLKIPIIAEDMGGTYGRTIEINSENGKLLIKTIGHGVKEI